MKNIAYISVILTGIMLGFSSCKKQEDIYKDYVVSNGLVYPGPVMNPIAKPGDRRIEIEWKRGVDPRVVKARIFWNNYTDSVEVACSRDMDIVSKIIPLPENTYTFMIHTYDAEGNVSIPVELQGRVYGPTYTSMLSNRVLLSTVYDGSDLTLNWHDAEKTVVGVNLTYSEKNVTGTKTYVVDPSEMVTVIPRFDMNKPLIYSTVHKPDFLAIDLLYAIPIEIMIDPWITIPRSEWTAEHSSVHDSNVASRAIDGNPGTFWHSQAQAQYPHWLTFDMKKVIKVRQMTLVMRAESPANTFRHFMLQGRLDGETDWTDYPPEGTDYYSFEPVGLSRQTFTVPGDPEMQHIRLWFVNSHNQIYAVLAEFEVFGAFK